MTQKIIEKNSSFDFLGQHLEVAYRRGELLGYKKAMLELTKMETKLTEELVKMTKELEDETDS